MMIHEKDWLKLTGNRDEPIYCRKEDVRYIGRQSQELQSNTVVLLVSGASVLCTETEAQVFGQLTAPCEH